MRITKLILFYIWFIFVAILAFVVLYWILKAEACEEGNPPAAPGGIVIEAPAEGSQFDGGIFGQWKHNSGVTKEKEQERIGLEINKDYWKPDEK